MKGEILSVGTELLLGHLVDTNAPYLAQSLSGIGADIFWISQVGDNQERLVQAIRRAWERSDLVVMTGGLATMESCTGGQLSMMLATSPSAAESFRGGFVAYQPDLLGLLGIDPALADAGGAVTDVAARAMAKAARERGRAAVGLAATCGPDGTTSAGTNVSVVHCAADLRGNVVAVTNRYTTTARDVARRAVLDALDLLRRQLLSGAPK